MSENVHGQGLALRQTRAVDCERIIQKVLVSDAAKANIKVVSDPAKEL